MSTFETRKAAVLQALDDFYTPGMAEAFLYDRNRLLGDKKAIDLLHTDAGYKQVMDVVERLRDGVYI